MTDNDAGENRKIRKGIVGLRQKWVWLVTLCCLLCNRPVFAEDKPAAHPSPTLDNIGFVHNPEALHQKFPMCDAFLKVEWIDTKKKIGYSQYEITVEKTGEKKTVWALVTLNDEGAHYLDWNVYTFKHAGKLEDLFAFVRRARIASRNLAAMVLQDDKRKEVFHRMNITNDASIAGYRQTICLAYPDEELAWIVEGKNVKNGLKEPGLAKEIERAKLDIGITYKLADEPALVQPWLFDINYDNKIDLIWHSPIPLGVIYSVGGAYYSKKRRFEPEGSLDRVLKFPPLNKECFVRSGIENLTTDGKNYYFGKECNITKLTSVNDKE